MFSKRVNNAGQKHCDILHPAIVSTCIKLPLVFKETRFPLYGLGGPPSLLSINSPDIIAHIKGLSYLSDYMVIRATLGGAF